MSKKIPKVHLLDRIWDAWCLLSIIGIWPRFIEPNLLMTTELSLPVKDLPPDLERLKILQFSDLHLHPRVPQRFLKTILSKVEQHKPDLIVFTGDFLCHARMHDPKRLLRFLNSFHAPYGCYAIVGNHDYESGITVNVEGEYDVRSEMGSDLAKGFERLLKSLHLKKKTSATAKKLKVHQELKELLEQSPFELLYNQCLKIPIKNSFLNLCGLAEFMIGQHDPQTAFASYDSKYPGIILAHNPDTAPHLTEYPGEIVLSGHTHGSQINLPFFRNRFMVLENPSLMKGLHQIDGKWIYVNRGVGSTFPFRWFSPPEILLLTLVSEK